VPGGQPVTSVVLLSAGRHPVSGATALSRLEAQAIRLATGLGEAVGLHAGPAAAAVALGHGLSRIVHVRVPAGADPVPALSTRLAGMAPGLILAGRRGQGGDETGMVPYAVAEALDCLLIPDIVALAPGDAGELSLDQTLGRGARRRVRLRGPVLATIHPDAPAPLPFAYGQAPHGVIETVAGDPAAAAAPVPVFEERPYRRRPKIVKGAPSGGSAAERLWAATGEAAREILAHLRRIGVLGPPARESR
jgi:electron transfer flavoprotein beta subunit